MSKDFLGKGWKFPVQADTTGNLVLSAFEEDIRESIRIILLTSKGERVMQPQFGAGLRDYMFASMNAANLGAIQSEVFNALIEWEPRIEVISVEVEADQLDIGKLFINIDYRVRATNTRFNLVFPFYLEENK